MFTCNSLTNLSARKEKKVRTWASLYLWTPVVNAINDLFNHFASCLQCSGDNGEVNACDIKGWPPFLFAWRCHSVQLASMSRHWNNTMLFVRPVMSKGSSYQRKNTMWGLSCHWEAPFSKTTQCYHQACCDKGQPPFSETTQYYYLLRLSHLSFNVLFCFHSSSLSMIILEACDVRLHQCGTCYYYRLVTVWATNTTVPKNTFAGQGHVVLSHLFITISVWGCDLENYFLV